MGTRYASHQAASLGPQCLEWRTAARFSSFGRAATTPMALPRCCAASIPTPTAFSCPYTCRPANVVRSVLAVQLLAQLASLG